MEDDLERARVRLEAARRALAEAQPQVDELEMLIRGVRRYVTPDAPPPAPASVAQPEPEPAAEPQVENGAARWAKDTSIRSAAIQILGRTPDRVVSSGDIAATLLSEGYPYTGDTSDLKKRLSKLRETVSAVLNQHIKGGHNPPLAKPEPARYALLQTDVMAEQENLLNMNDETAEDPRANADSTVSES
jgi:hypothetical protein